jgi:GDPmannose 4,6-dehydratase
MKKRALITGITGQDGHYLAKHLLSLNYEVFGLARGQSNPKLEEVLVSLPGVNIVNGDLTDLPSLVQAMKISNPDEIYNLGAISFVGMSWNQAELTGDVTGLGVLRILEAARIHTGNEMEKVKFYQASSSEMFGQVREIPQNEKTPFHPRSPYGVAKTFGHYITVNYRESYSAFAVSGILFNHESPRRGAEFVSRKITKGVARIALGDKNPIKLGNLDARRDWGHARDYVEAMHLMLQQTNPKDYVIGTGITHSVRELLTVAFAEIGINNWDEYVIHDPAQIRPAEVDLLVADTQNAREELGWIPKTTFEELISEMVQYDIKELRKS